MQRNECHNLQCSIDHLYDGIEILWKRIERLEKCYKEAETIIEVLSKHSGKLQEDMQEIAKWRKGIKILTDQSKKPNKCPICNGKGNLNNFKPIHAGVNMICMLCHSCEGKGIVWG